VRTRVDIQRLASLKQVRLGFPNFISKLAEEQYRVVHVASSHRSHESEVTDSRFDDVGCGAVKFGPSYPSLDVFFLLAHRGILVFYFHYK
jgi:hypothetical protein